MALTKRSAEESTLLGPATVPTNELRANPHNPRRLFDEAPMKTLEESIRKVGILVPLTVFKARGSDKYTILDGQRRWICAQRLSKREVPINQVKEPSIVENITTMFQIHKLRRDWELMPTALKVEVLMNELSERRDKPLAELTHLDVSVVTRCKKLLWYPEKYQEMMLFTDPEDRVKADFFIELYPVVTDRTVKSADWYKRNHIIDRFLYKYQNKLSGFKAITDFRKIKQYLTAARAAKQEAATLRRFKRLLDDDDLNFSILEVDAARIHREATTLVRRVNDLRDMLRNLEADAFAGEEDLWHSLERLAIMLRRKLSEADRR
jgi:ParB family transcriptional regulator, chromosome partitioning protein